MVLFQLGKSCGLGERICLDLPAGRVNLSNFDKTWRLGKRILSNLTNVVGQESRFVQIRPMLPAWRANLFKFVLLTGRKCQIVVFCKH